MPNRRLRLTDIVCVSDGAAHARREIRHRNYLVPIFPNLTWPSVRALWPCEFPQNMPNESRPINQVTLPEFSRFLDKSPQSFQPEVAEPIGCVLHLATEKTESRADAHGYGHIKVASMFKYPSLLLRQTQSHPQNIGLGSIDHVYNFIIFLLRKGPKRGRKCSSCPMHGVFGFKILLKPSQRTLSITIEKTRLPVRSTRGRQRLNGLLWAVVLRVFQIRDQRSQSSEKARLRSRRAEPGSSRR